MVERKVALVTTGHVGAAHTATFRPTIATSLETVTVELKAFSPLAFASNAGHVPRGLISFGVRHIGRHFLIALGDAEA